MCGCENINKFKNGGSIELDVDLVLELDNKSDYDLVNKELGSDFYAVNPKSFELFADFENTNIDSDKIDEFEGYVSDELKKLGVKNYNFNRINKYGKGSIVSNKSYGELNAEFDKIDSQVRKLEKQYSVAITHSEEYKASMINDKLQKLREKRQVLFSQLSKFKNGGGVEVEEEYNSEEDLFKHTETLPDEVRKVLDKYGEDWEATYENCENMLQELEPLGYTFDYYLDAEPYNLRKLEEFNNGGDVGETVIVYAENKDGHRKIISEHKSVNSAQNKIKKISNEVFNDSNIESIGTMGKIEFEKYYKDFTFANGGGVGELPLIKRIKGYEIRYNEKEKTWKFPVFKGGEELTAFGYKSEAEEWIYDQLGSDFENGGGIGNQNALMVMNDNKQIKHHTEELNKVVNTNTEVPAWVVSKVHRSASDLSDATHYLDGVNSEFKNGGGVGYGEIKKEKEKMTTELFNKLGVFFAFSNEQFNENKTPLKEGEKYVSIGAGGYIPKGNLDAFLEGMKSINQIGKKKVKENKLAETEILYELKNHECFYTGDYSDVVDMFKGTYTEKQIRDVYNKHRESNQDFDNGGSVSINSDNYSDLSFDNSRFKQRQKAFVGYLGDTISIQIAETFLGRKINSWNDDIIILGDTKYKKVYLRPEYKQIS